MQNITIQSTDGKTYSIVATEDEYGLWSANIAEVNKDGSAGRTIMDEDEFVHEFGARPFSRACLQVAAGVVIF